MKLDNTTMSFGGSSIVLRKTAVEQNSQFKKVSDTYSEHSKLVFLFDVSGSMASPIARDRHGVSYADFYLWTPEILADIRKRVQDVVDKSNRNDDVNSPDFNSIMLTQEELDLTLLFDGRNAQGQHEFRADDDTLKDRIILKDLIKIFGILHDPAKKKQEPPTRMGVVKKLAMQEIAARFKKFPKSRVAVVPFGDNPITLFDDGPAEQVEVELAKLDHRGMSIIAPSGERTEYTGGGTDILKAIRRGMDICRNNPSAVGIHHFILVTDGEDWNAGTTIAAWVPNMKASGIVLDYIHIGDSVVNDGLREACKLTGGEYVMVNTEKDLAEKFQIATNRLCLPPAATK